MIPLSSKSPPLARGHHETEI